MNTTEILNAVASSLQAHFAAIRAISLTEVIVENYDAVYDEELRQISHLAGYHHCLRMKVVYDEKHFPTSDNENEYMYIYIFLDRFFVPKAMNVDMYAGPDSVSMEAGFKLEYRLPITNMVTAAALTRIMKEIVSYPSVVNTITKVTLSGIEYEDSAFYTKQLLNMHSAIHPSLLVTKEMLATKLGLTGFQFDAAPPTRLPSAWTPYKIITTLRHYGFEEPEVELQYHYDALAYALDLVGIPYSTVERKHVDHLTHLLAVRLQQMPDADYEILLNII